MNLLKLLITSLVIMFFVSGCATPVLEQVRLPGELHGWKLGHKARDRLTSSTRWEHIPEQEYISRWTRLFTIQFYSTKQTDPEAFMNSLKAKQLKQCKDIVWRVLEKQASSILYEWRIKGCKRFKDRHELARLIRGKAGMHRVAYTEKTWQIANETYQKWKKKLLGARLETGSQ